MPMGHSKEDEGDGVSQRIIARKTTAALSAEFGNFGVAIENLGKAPTQAGDRYIGPGLEPHREVYREIDGRLSDLSNPYL